MGRARASTMFQLELRASAWLLHECTPELRVSRELCEAFDGFWNNKGENGLGPELREPSPASVCFGGKGALGPPVGREAAHVLGWLACGSPGHFRG